MPAQGTSEFRTGDSKTLKERWKAYLATHRLNTTNQREAIVDQFLKSQEHISIEELLARVRKRHARVGYATVYRTLKLLVSASGGVQTVPFEGGETPEVP